MSGAHRRRTRDLERYQKRPRARPTAWRQIAEPFVTPARRDPPAEPAIRRTLGEPAGGRAGRARRAGRGGRGAATVPRGLGARRPPRRRWSWSAPSRAGELVGHGLEALLADRRRPRAGGADVAQARRAQPAPCPRGRSRLAARDRGAAARGPADRPAAAARAARRGRRCRRTLAAADERRCGDRALRATPHVVVFSTRHH